MDINQIHHKQSLLSKVLQSPSKSTSGQNLKKPNIFRHKTAKAIIDKDQSKISNTNNTQPKDSKKGLDS